MIYAIEAVGLERVKFGRAGNPEKRFKVLSTASPVPLELIIVVPWPDLYEGVIHRAFEDERITGEWFLATKRVEKFCQAMGCPNSTDDERFENSMALIDDTQRCKVREKLPGSTPTAVPKVGLMAQSLTEMATDVLRDIEATKTETTPPAPLPPAVHGDGEAPPEGYPLTNAEKQKAYRAHHKDKVREADRHRKRRKRTDGYKSAT